MPIITTGVGVAASGVIPVATTVAGLGATANGAQGLIRAGTTPFEYLPVVFDTTLNKWVSAPIVVAAFSGSATHTGDTVFAGVTDTWQAFVPYKVFNTAGLTDQWRITALLSCSGGATGSVAITLQGFNLAGALVSVTAAEFSTGTTASATAVGVDGGWAVPGSPTIVDMASGHIRIKTSSAAQTVTLTNAQVSLRWVA